MSIRAIDGSTRAEVDRIIKDEWHGPMSVSRGNVLDTSVLPGFVFVEDNRVKGAVTYNIAGGECEIATLNSFTENRGIGTGLINAVLEAARENNCYRVWLITTNDDIRAIRFYQKRGFDLVAVHINAMNRSRELKPEIPLIGLDGIPILHEFEFAIRLA